MIFLREHDSHKQPLVVTRVIFHWLLLKINELDIIYESLPLLNRYSVAPFRYFEGSRLLSPPWARRLIMVATDFLKSIRAQHDACTNYEVIVVKPNVHTIRSATVYKQAVKSTKLMKNEIDNNKNVFNCNVHILMRWVYNLCLSIFIILYIVTPGNVLWTK